MSEKTLDEEVEALIERAVIAALRRPAVQVELRKLMATEGDLRRTLHEQACLAVAEAVRRGDPRLRAARL